MLAVIQALVAEATEAGHEAAAAVAEKSGGLPQLNVENFAPQLFWLAVTFALLYLIMSRVALPRVGEVIEERRDRIQRDLDTADRLKGETEKALAGYEKALGDARAQASTLAREMRDKLTADVEAEKAKVESLLAGKLAEAESRIGAMKTKALASITEIAAATAGDVVAKLTGQSAGADEIKRALAPQAGE